MEPKCCFYKEAEENIATNGPKGTIVQYFACQTFIETAPKDRFQELKNKGDYFQNLFPGASQDKEKHHDGMCQRDFVCLFPGASQNKEKHHDGMCQRDFVCKHKSHEKYLINKYVLVCHEHRDDTDNQELLQNYKGKFIKNQLNQLPSFSRDLKLSFYMNQNQFQILKKCQTKRRQFTFCRQ